VATSYAHFYGSGYRSLTIDRLVSGVNFNPVTLVDGVKNAGGQYFNSYGGAGAFIQFCFSGDLVVIDEATWYQQNANSHGTWKWQGSDDGVNWYDIGGTFALGGSTAQVQATLHGNTTAYKYYRLYMVGGSCNEFCLIYEIEFRVDIAPGVSKWYGNPGGAGDRQAIIAITPSFQFANGRIWAYLINGLWESGTWVSLPSVTGHTVVFDFGVPQIITGAKFFAAAGNYGVWQCQGSNDLLSWDDIGANFTLQTSGILGYITSLAENNAGYRYYRLLGISGSWYAGDCYEILFQLGDAPQNPAKSFVELLGEAIPAKLDDSVVELFTEAITLPKPAKSYVDLAFTNLAKANPADSFVELDSPGPKPHAGLFMVF
jgi:hypothetical protein